LNAGAARPPQPTESGNNDGELVSDELKKEVEKIESEIEGINESIVEAATSVNIIQSRYRRLSMAFAGALKSASQNNRQQ